MFGLSSHLYALRDERDAGIGDFETLARFAETTARLGGALVGINPLHHLFPDDRGRASPYQPSDRRFLDPIYIDVDGVATEFAGTAVRELLAARRPALAELRRHRYVDYAAVWRLKEEVLDRAFAIFERRPIPLSKGSSPRAERHLERHAEFQSRNQPASRRAITCGCSGPPTASSRRRRAGEGGRARGRPLPRPGARLRL